MPETPKHNLRYPVPTDPDTIALYYQHLAEDVERELDAITLTQLAPGTAGELIIVDGTGAATYKAMKGDGTIDDGGNFQLGDSVVGTAELADKAVTAAKIDNASVTSPKAKLTVGVKHAKGTSLTLEKAHRLVTGSELGLELSVKSTVLLIPFFDFEPVGQTARGFIHIDSFEGEFAPAAMKGLERGMACAADIAELEPGAHTISLRASGDGSRVLLGSTGFLYQVFAA